MNTLLTTACLVASLGITVSGCGRGQPLDWRKFRDSSKKQGEFDNFNQIRHGNLTPSVAENAGPLVLTLSRFGYSGSGISIDYATSDRQARAGIDYVAVAGTVTWGTEDFAKKTISIPILTDAKVEGDETFVVTFSNVRGARLSTSELTCKIVDSASFGMSAGGMSAVTETDVAVFAEVSGGPTVLRSVVRGTQVGSPPVTLLAERPGVIAGASAAISDQGHDATSIRISGFGRVDPGTKNGRAGTAATADAKQTTQAGHSWIVTFGGVPGSSIDLTMVGSAAGGGQGHVLVDLEANGSIDLAWVADGTAIRRSLRFAGTSRTARVTLAGDAPVAGASYSMHVTLSPSPGVPDASCLVTPYGIACSNTRLAGKDVPDGRDHVLGLQISHAIPGKPVALAIGATTVPGSGFGSACQLLGAPHFVIGLSADPAGNASFTLRFPLSIRTKASLQAMPYEPGGSSVRWSNGLRIDAL